MSGPRDIGWESLLTDDAPRDSRLEAALFTTYERPDERFLVQHLLPALLRTERDPESEGIDRQYFLLELHKELERLHDRVVVVSSNAREEPIADEDRGTPAYGWIWRHLRALAAGHDGKVVQHAKLWMLHWTSREGHDYLELAVSSGNLTRAAFQGQLQAAWRTCIKLQPRRSEDRLTAWGVLPSFLGELSASCGVPGRLDSFVTLLSRAECPAGVTFTASVPGNHSKQALSRMPWGTAGLAKVAPPGRGAVSVSVLVPYVGSWSARSLESWCAAFAGTASRLELLWLDRDHLWANHWVMPAGTLKALQEVDAPLSRLCHHSDQNARFDSFHEEHHRFDARWSHAKLYHFRRGRSQRLLVTSANFSMAAWGTPAADGSLSIENFEFGVCVEQAAWPFSDLEPLGKNAATVPKLPSRVSNKITWADASWDGRTIVLECRCPAECAIAADLKAGTETVALREWTRSNRDRSLRRSEFAWCKAWCAPFTIELDCEGEVLSVPIFDTRPQAERENTFPPEVDADAETVQTMLDRLLFEQYGGRLADPDEPAENEPPIEGEGRGDDDNFGNGDSYTVPVFVLAREYFVIVDNWATAVRSAPEGDSRFVVLRDGERLAEAFRRQADRSGSSSVGANVAREEIMVRLKLLRNV